MESLPPTAREECHDQEDICIYVSAAQSAVVSAGITQYNPRDYNIHTNGTKAVTSILHHVEGEAGPFK
jgi:hypothetical protein